jgi:hypothetical protein
VHPISENLQPPIRKVIDLDHFAAKTDCQTFRLKRQLHAAGVHHQLVRHLTLLAPSGGTRACHRSAPHQDGIPVLYSLGKLLRRPTSR